MGEAKVTGFEPGMEGNTKQQNIVRNARLIAEDPRISGVDVVFHADYRNWGTVTIWFEDDNVRPMAWEDELDKLDSFVIGFLACLDHIKASRPRRNFADGWPFNIPVEGNPLDG